MAKHAKDQETKVIHLKDYQPDHSIERPQVKYEYDGAPKDDFLEEGEEPEEVRRKKEQRHLPKAVYYISLVLLAVVIGLSLWMNREYLNWDTLKEWTVLQIRGEENGDGFPVQITGANVYAGNFLCSGSSAVVLSNTAFTSINSRGAQEASIQHSLSQPVLQAAGGRYLLYNQGSTGYMTLSAGQVAVSGAAEENIIAGCVSPQGNFALGLEGNHGASKLQVFLKDGSLQYEYPFANDYITAAAINYDGTFGAVCTVNSEKGEMVSKLTILDFTQPEPVTQFETRSNLLWAAYWGENGVIYAVGDGALVTGKSSDYQFTEFDYQGRQLTAFCLDSGRAFLSISAYEHVGASTLLAFNGGEAYGETNPVRMELSERIEAISVSGGTVGVLAGGQVAFRDYTTGMELGRADAGADAKSLALASERKAYILGASEIRTAEIE